MREFFTTGCVSFRTGSSREISEASLGESAPRKMRKLGKLALAHAVACCGIAPSGARRREGEVAPGPAADAAGCTEIAAPRLTSRSRAERSFPQLTQQVVKKSPLRGSPRVGGSRFGWSQLGVESKKTRPEGIPAVVWRRLDDGVRIRRCWGCGGRGLRRGCWSFR